MYLQSGSANTWSAAYSSPNDSTDGITARIGYAASNSGGGAQAIASGGRIYLVRIYNRALTKTELDQNFTALRSRFGFP
jgi:hypothetical protein